MLKFWFAFAGLTALYGLATWGIIYLYAKWQKTDMWKYLGNNNTPLYVGILVTIITFVIACFNFGPALLLPENIPTAEQRGDVANLVAHLLHGKNAPAKSVPTNPLPWATGTWFWMKAACLYGFLTLIYIPFGLYDEAERFCRGVKRIIGEHRTRHTEHREGGHSHTGPTGHSFGELLKADIIAEIFSEFLKTFLKRS